MLLDASQRLHLHKILESKYCFRNLLTSRVHELFKYSFFTSHATASRFLIRHVFCTGPDLKALQSNFTDKRLGQFIWTSVYLCIEHMRYGQHAYALASYTHQSRVAWKLKWFNNGCKPPWRASIRCSLGLQRPGPGRDTRTRGCTPRLAWPSWLSSSSSLQSL